MGLKKALPSLAITSLIQLMWSQWKYQRLLEINRGCPWHSLETGAELIQAEVNS